MKTLHRECSVNRLSVARSTQDSRAATVNERGTRLTTYSTVHTTGNFALWCASLARIYVYSIMYKVI